MRTEVHVVGPKCRPPRPRRTPRRRWRCARPSRRPPRSSCSRRSRILAGGWNLEILSEAERTVKLILPFPKVQLHHRLHHRRRERRGTGPSPPGSWQWQTERSRKLWLLWHFSFETMTVYRVTIQLVQKLLLTLICKLRFYLRRSRQVYESLTLSSYIIWFSSVIWPHWYSAKLFGMKI